MNTFITTSDENITFYVELPTVVKYNKNGSVSKRQEKHPFMADWCKYKDGLKQIGFSLYLHKATNIWRLNFKIKKKLNVFSESENTCNSENETDIVLKTVKNALSYFNIKSIDF